MSKNTHETITMKELAELADYLIAPKPRDARYRELLAKYQEAVARKEV